MTYNQDILKFWKNDNFKNITAGGKQFPEGWDVRPFLGELVGGEDVIEIGCGYGRLVEAFSPKQYAGVDINPAGVEEARNRNPEYTFHYFDVNDALSPSTWLMFYTVLLHVNDDDILPYLQSVTANTQKVLVAEILGQRWRIWKYAFNREEREYELLLNQCGFHKTGSFERPYTHYKDTNITFMTFER